MPELMSAALFERDDRVLTAHRKDGRPPFAGHWLLPMTTVRDEETAEDAVRRHAREQFGVSVSDEIFVDTLYLEDPVSGQYVTNVFRASLGAGPMRFNAAGDYDDARWLTADELPNVFMPPSLRDPLLRILKDAAEYEEYDWEASAAAAAAASAEAQPLAEREEAPVAVADEEQEPPPDNAVSWDAIAKSYQDEVFGERFGDRLMWTWATSEDELRLLDDVSGKHVIVIGCGGGQDVVALTKMGAIAVGVDVSSEQIAYARKYAAKHGADNASFVVGTVEDLSRFDDASFDVAVSAHMLNYVERIEDTLREVARVLRPGGVFALSVIHPIDAVFWGSRDETPVPGPYRAARSYFDVRSEFTWGFDSGKSGRFRQWIWPVSRWFEMLTGAGFEIERLVELSEADPDGRIDAGRARYVPHTLAFKTRKR